MTMEFDKRPRQKSNIRKISQSKSEIRRGQWLLFDYPRNRQNLQTRFLEDLILS